MFLASNEVKMFPSAFRDRAKDPESYLNTEYNVTHTGYLGNDQYSYSYMEGTTLVLNIKGYIFRIESSKVPGYTNLYAYIKLKAHETKDNGNVLYKNLILVNIDDDSIELDTDNNIFKGLGFISSTETPSETDCYYIKVRDAAGEIIVNRLLEIVVDNAMSTTSENAVQNQVITGAINAVSAAKQDKITSTNKISADNVDDTSTTNKFVTSSEKSTWNGKQDALSSSQLSVLNSGITSTKVTNYDNHIANNSIHVTSSEKSTWNNKQDTIVAGTGIVKQGNTISVDTSDIVLESSEGYQALEYDVAHRPHWYKYENVTLQSDGTQTTNSYLISFITNASPADFGITQYPIPSGEIDFNIHDAITQWSFLDWHLSSADQTTFRVYYPAGLNYYYEDSTNTKTARYFCYFEIAGTTSTTIRAISISNEPEQGRVGRLRFTPITYIEEIENSQFA